MSKLTVDCLYEIFQYLDEDTKSLYSCLLVNRKWCETIVPILWRNPLKSNKLYSKVGVSLFCTLFSCLEEETKNFLKICNINPTSLTTTTEYSFKVPLFKYPIYCRYLDFRKLHVIINQQFDDEDHKNIVRQEILKLIISKSNSIKQIIIQDVEHSQSIANFPGAERSLSQLVELQCDSEMDSLFYFELARICKNIQRLQISYSKTDNVGLISLIKVQRSLKYLRCEAIDKLGEFQEIGKALSEYQSKSLIEIVLLEDKSIPVECFSSFINLKRLKIECIYGDSLSPKDYYLLSKTKLPKLEYLSIEVELPHLDILTGVISSTTGNLTHIYLGSFIPEEQDDGYQFIESYHKIISKHCPNLRYVSTFVYEDDENKNNKNNFGLKDLMIFCNKLKGIVFNGIKMDSDGFDLFNLIRRYAPYTLSDIKIVGGCEIKSYHLEWFLENWRSREPLSLSISEGVCDLSEDLDDVRDKFLEKGVLKNYQVLDFLEDFETD